MPFQSTPPARGATYTRNQIINKSEISIHAPREGGDGRATLHIITLGDISIHAPREGGDGAVRYEG